jgi:LPXTG-motif cell wall-anchored protein
VRTAALVGAALLLPVLLCGATHAGDDERLEAAAVSVTVHISPWLSAVSLPGSDCVILCGLETLPQTGGGEAGLLPLAGGAALLVGGVLVWRHVRRRGNPGS